MAGRGVLVIADVVLDLDRGRLRRSGGAGIPLRPKSLQLLEVLASNPGRLMTKAQLLDSVWPSIHVTEDSLFQCIRDVRRALGDFDGRMLRTVAKKGYLLDVPVEARPDDLPANSQAWQRMDSPSLAVLPFSEDGGADGEGYFAEGFTSDLLAGLCRIRWLPVVARGSSFLFKDGRTDLRQVARRLGVRYVMQGSIQRADGRLRVYTWKRRCKSLPR
jgi:DNA-binding winged helix-turn-helix (wHTH) protein